MTNPPPNPIPFNLFISYAHADDQDGWVTAFVKSIEDEFRRFTTRDLKPFFDKHDIATMADWNSHILTGLKQSRVMLAILSPAYMKSQFCRKEWRIFTEHEVSRAMLEQHAIAPLYYVTVPGLRGKGTPEIAAKEWIKEINARQIDDICDAREWSKGGIEALQTLDVAQRIKGLCERIRDRIELAERKTSSYSNVPKFNPNFVGRIQDLRTLRHTLEERPVGAVVGVQGIGGIGKTELAFTYAHAYADVYPGGRYLVKAEGLTDIREALIRLTDDCDGRITITPELRADLDRGAAHVRSQIIDRGLSLLILDNVDSAELLAPVDLNSVLPDRNHLHILVTTRMDPAEIPIVDPLSVNELEEEDALRLLEKHFPFADDDEREAALKIVTAVGRHPQACEIIGVYLGMKRSKPITYSEYLQWLNKDVMAALDLDGTKVKLSLQRNPEPLIGKLLEPTLAQLSKAERWVLDHAALLPPDQVPMPWLQELLRREMPEEVQATGPGRADPWDRIVDHLNGLRLLLSQGEVKSSNVGRMHRIVQAALKVEIVIAKENEKLILSYTVERAVCFEEGSIPDDRSWELRVLVSMAESLKRGAILQVAILSRSIAIPLDRWGETLAATTFANRALQMLELSAKALPDDDEVKRELSASYNVVGDLERNVGNLERAFALFHSALWLRETLSGKGPKITRDSHSLCCTLFRIGDLERRFGNTKKAKAIFERTLNIGENLIKCGQTDARTQRNLSISIELLGALEQNDGNHREARTLYLKAMEIGQALCAKFPNDLRAKRDLLVSYRYLGSLDHDAGNFERALHHYKCGIALGENLVESMPNDILVKRDLSLLLLWLGDLEQDAGKRKHARELYKKAHGLREVIADQMPGNAKAEKDLERSLTRLSRLDDGIGNNHGSTTPPRTRITTDPRKAMVKLKNAMRAIVEKIF